MPKPQNRKPDIRYLNDMKDVLYDKKWVKNALNVPLYYMYRGIRQEGNLRYDETIIPARMLGSEFVKTKGHYHIGNFGELYKVLKGEAIFLFQKRVPTMSGRVKMRTQSSSPTSSLTDAYYVRAKKGDFIVIKPEYGHITINAGESDLKISNWISKECKSDYTNVERKKGFCYYYTKQGWVKNNAYKKIPKLRFEKPQKAMPRDLSFIYGN